MLDHVATGGSMIYRNIDYQRLHVSVQSPAQEAAGPLPFRGMTGE